MSAVFRFRSVPADWQRLQPPPPAGKADATPAALRISVVVPASGPVPQLLRCLDALLAQNADPRSYEILVVDPQRDKAARRAVQALAATLAPHRLHYLRPLDDGHGAAAARNRGWRAARAPLIAFTDPATVADPDWLLEGDKAMHAQRCIALAGHIAAASGVPPRAGGDRVVEQRRLPRLDGANSFVWRKALQAVGGFDERFSDPAHEAADLQFRLQREGPIGAGRQATVSRTAGGGRWTDALRAQRDRFFDALLYREHRLVYRSQRGAAPPWGSYAAVALALAALGSALAGAWTAAQLFVGVSALTIASLAWRRRRRPGTSPGRGLGSLATSALIPFLTVYWRLRGAWHYRVWFV